MRKIKFATKGYYHIFNRGVDKREIFMDEKDYLRFLRSMREFNRPEAIESLYRLDQLRRRKDEETKSLRLVATNRRDLVSLIAYCLNPNHYHLLVKQITDKGIEKFMHKLGLSYTQYFNHKNKRSGSLFQGTYQAVEIKSDYQLWYVSAYINGNAEIHGVSRVDKWFWSSYQYYLGKRNGTLANKNIILKDFKNKKDYKDYIGEVIKNSRDIKCKIKEELKNLQIE